ncbi:MAG: TonB-dependent receptor [Myxococcota bacterium]|nr:TonB-dependent receptor [Myxococcota bacterium]
MWIGQYQRNVSFVFLGIVWFSLILAMGAAAQDTHTVVISSREIQMSGVSTIDELLRRMPVVTLQGLSKQNNADGHGLARIDLRNLGSRRTLVLVNGKRIISAFGEGVDLNNIPIHMIDRVEILLHGASATYGSDAMGGVVNIIYKERFEGFRADVSGGITTLGDGENLTVSGTMGESGERGDMVLNLTYHRRNEIWQKDRKWAQPVVQDQRYDIDEWGNPTGEISTLYNSIFTPGGIAYSSLGAHYFHPDGTFEPYEGWVEWSNPNGLRYNYGRDQFLVGKMERFIVTALGTYDILECVTAYAQGDFTHRQSLNQLAAQPVGMGSDIFPGPLAIPVTNPYMPDAYAAALSPTQGTVWMYKRMASIGPRQYENANETFRAIAGLRGELGPRLAWDAHINYSKMRNTGTKHNSVNLRNLVTALDPDLCAANPMCPGIANVFGANQLQDDVAAFIRFRAQEQAMWDMVHTGVFLEGDIISLPGGYLTSRVGADVRWQRGYSLPDALVLSGDAASRPEPYSGGDYNLQEVFASFSIPLLKDLPAADALTIDLAGRLSNYSTFGSELTYGAHVAWNPLPHLLLRGGYATGFRAPNINELYGGATYGYRIVIDPCNYWETSSNQTVQANCAAQGVPQGWVQGPSTIRTQGGGNPDLGAETSSQLSLGTVFTPTFIPKPAGEISITLDFYSISVDKALNTLDTQVIVDRCYNSPNMSHSYCRFVGNRAASHDIMGIVAGLQNVAEIQTKGIDFSVKHGLPVTPQLRIDVAIYGNILLQMEQEITGKTEDRLGTVDLWAPYRGAMPKFRALAELKLGGSMWQVSNRLRLIGPVEYFDWQGGDEGQSDDLPSHDYKGMAYWDMSAIFFWRGFDVIIGMDNIVAPEPPFIPGGDTNSSAHTYDFVGRYIHAKVGYKF